MDDLERVWTLSDHFFFRKLPAEHRYTRPIDLRNPFIFYYGHLPAFAWNTISKSHSLPPHHSQYDALFSRGIDPDVEDPSICNDHPDAPDVWPQWHQVETYVANVRDKIRQTQISLRVLRLVTEHEAMHVETLFYMLAQLQPCIECPLPSIQEFKPIAMDWLDVPAGETYLGVAETDTFLWDNELDKTQISVPSFKIAKHAVSISDYSAFIAAGGYRRAEFWTKEDWSWVERERLQYPRSWRLTSTGFALRTDIGFGEATPRNWNQVGDLPVSVSLAEARAYSKWLGAGLISEAQWVYAAYGPLGARASKTSEAGGSRPESVKAGQVSWSGAVGMVGNGWEMTTTIFSRFEGFRDTAEYIGYSSDFFDDKHCVLRGGSWTSDICTIRSSFRNFYQARYPYVFSKIRMIRDA